MISQKSDCSSRSYRAVERLISREGGSSMTFKPGGLPIRSPGVSGSAIAAIFGIHDRLLDATSGFLVHDGGVIWAAETQKEE